jgi:hypothetical protein
MPIQSYKLPPDISGKVKKKINQLLRKKVLHTMPEDEASYQAGFCLPIQLVSKPNADPLDFSKPEGFRIFIQKESTVIAMVDFIQRNKRLALIAIHQGPGLHVLLKALNKLEAKYDKLKAACRPELIYFLLSKGPFLKVKSGKQVSFFKYHHDKLSPVSPKQINREITSAIKYYQNTAI